MLLIRFFPDVAHAIQMIYFPIVLLLPSTVFGCNEDAFPDKRRVCGDCKVLVNNFESSYGGSCEIYCRSIGKECVAGWEEVSNTCEEESSHSCQAGKSGTNDAICECSADTTTTTTTNTLDIAVDGMKETMQQVVANVTRALEEGATARSNLNALRLKLDAERKRIDKVYEVLKLAVTAASTTPPNTIQAPACSSQCSSPSVEADGGDLKFLAPEGAMVFETSTCGVTDPCALKAGIAQALDAIGKLDSDA